MEVVIEFNEPAFRHGVGRDDIPHAFRYYKYDGPMESMGNRYIRLGVDRAGNLPELMCNEVDDNTAVVFHTMKCRSIFYYLLNQE